MSCAFLFLCVNIEGDLDFYFNKLIRFLVLFIWVVALDYFAGKTRSNLQKGVKRLERSFEGYKFIEYFCFHLFCDRGAYVHIIDMKLQMRNSALIFHFRFYNGRGGPEHEISLMNVNVNVNHFKSLSICTSLIIYMDEH